MNGVKDIQNQLSKRGFVHTTHQEEVDKKIRFIEKKIRFIEIILVWVVMWLIIITVILFMWRVGTVWGGQ